MAKIKVNDRLKPIPKKTKEEIEQERLELQEKNAVQELKNNVDSEHMFENASLEDYEKALENETVQEFSESDKTEMTKTILSLRNEIESLKEENLKLSEELESLKSNVVQKPIENQTDDVVCLKNNIERLKLENENVQSRNMELELKVSKLLEIEKIQQAKIDSFNHTYTQSNYNPSITVRGNGYRTNINGYQDWR